MKPAIMLAVLLFAAIGHPGVVNLRCEYAQDPLGIDTTLPRFSWQMTSTMRNDSQQSAQIIVASSKANIDANFGDMWSTSLNSSQSVNIEYVGAALSSAKRYYWKVNVNGPLGTNGWSAPATFTTGILNAADWSASWIGMASAGDHDCPWFRKSFLLSAIPDEAICCIGSIGYHELYINGHKVSTAVLTPSVSDLEKRVLYNTYDIRSYLKTGENVIGVWLGPGWSLFANMGGVLHNHSPKTPVFIGKVSLSDGTAISTNGTWKCSQSSTTHLGAWTNSNFGGDQIDARKQIANWNNTGLNDVSWENATAYSVNCNLSADLIPPNRQIDTIKPLSVSNIGTNKYLVDMGRLYTGWIEVALRNGTAGSKVTITASSWGGAEVEYNQLDEYIFDSSGQGTFCNRFSYHEIRYIVISGITYQPALQEITGYRVGNDLERLGSFDCSNPLLKKIYNNTLNNHKNLTTGGMTVDCPHRERLGYGGDAHTSMEMALNNYAMGEFFTKWTRDWCDIQEANGYIANSAPTYDGGGGPAWGGFVIDLPWEVYQTYGDTRLMATAFPSMKKWLSFLAATEDANGLIQPYNGAWWIGDWLSPHGAEWGGGDEALLFNNCYYLYQTRLLARIAMILGNQADAATYSAKAEVIKNALNTRFFNSDNKTYLDTRQTHCIMPLLSGAVSTQDIAGVMKNLENEINVNQKGHLDVGLSGMYYMTKYLTEADRSDLIFTYANQTTFPSYGYFIAKGYDTWPEEWTGDAGSSILHGCFNGIGAWFQEGLAGIRLDTAAPGFKRFIIKPSVVGDVSWVNATCPSMYGSITSNWMVGSSGFEQVIDIPANTRATVSLPTLGYGSVTVSEGGTTIWENGTASGSYHFRVSGSAEPDSLYITADNAYELYCNGQKIGTDSVWTTVEKYPVNLVPGKNVIAIKANDFGSARGLCAELRRGVLRFGTGADWKASASASADWNTLAFNDTNWANAAVEGPFGMAPWNVSDGMPAGTPAQWIWASDTVAQTVYVRYVVNVPDAATSTRPQTKSVTLAPILKTECVLGVNISIPGEFGGKPVILNVYDLKGRCILTTTTRKRAINLQKEYGIAKGLYIMRLTPVNVR